MSEQSATIDFARAECFPRVKLQKKLHGLEKGLESGESQKGDISKSLYLYTITCGSSRQEEDDLSVVQTINSPVLDGFRCGRGS